jgi:hypothetical protein
MPTCSSTFGILRYISIRERVTIVHGHQVPLSAQTCAGLHWAVRHGHVLSVMVTRMVCRPVRALERHPLKKAPRERAPLKARAPPERRPLKKLLPPEPSLPPLLCSRPS